jgi:hypothetical protein
MKLQIATETKTMAHPAELINEEKFKEEYQDTYADLLSRAGDRLKIEMLFAYSNDPNDPPAEVYFAGHVWEQNCFYTQSDLEQNGNFRIAEIESYFPIREWEQEVEERPNF